MWPGTMSLTEVWQAFILVALWPHCGLYAKVSWFQGKQVYFYCLERFKATEIGENLC